MAEKLPNPQLDFLQDEDEDDLEDFLIPENAAAAPVASADDDSQNEEGKAEAAELDAVTGPLGTPDADAPVAPAIPPSSEPAPAQAEVPPAAQPAAPVVQQEQPVSAPAAEAPSPSADDITKVYSDWRVQTEDLLAQHHYRLNEEELALLDTNPQDVIPRIAAKVYLDAVSAAITQVLTYLPQTVRQVHEQDRINNESENSFFGRWPALKEHKDSVMKIGQVYRQMNPRASAEQFINEVGAAAMVSLRLDPSGVIQPQAPSAPAPFLPAAQTPQGGIPKSPQRVNPFTQLNAEFDSFDEDID